MEFSFILTQVRKAGDSLAVGSLEELSVKAQRLMLVCRMISPQYFVAIAMAPEGNFGKARYLARLATPDARRAAATLVRARERCAAGPIRSVCTDRT